MPAHSEVFVCSCTAKSCSWTWICLKQNVIC